MKLRKAGIKGKSRQNNSKPGWLKLEGAFGKTAAERAETRRIQHTIDGEFERIEQVIL